MDVLNKYERARVLGSRALQISMGAPILVDLSEKELEAIHYNPIEIAKLELEKDVLPLVVVREAPTIEEEAPKAEEKPAEEESEAEKSAEETSKKSE